LKYVILYSAIVLTLFACRKDEYDTVRRSSDNRYFNQKSGAYSIYSVFEVVYDDFANTIDTSEYQLMEKNEAQFKDNLGRYATRIERYRRSNDTAEWTYINTWYSVSDEQMAERVEDNKRFIKLSFPITIDAVWNANSLNMDNVNNVYYGMMHRAYKQDTFTFDSVVSVESGTINNAFRERAYKEIYAKNIGLVFRNYVYIDKLGLLLRGSRIRYQLIRHVP